MIVSEWPLLRARLKGPIMGWSKNGSGRGFLPPSGSEPFLGPLNIKMIGEPLAVILYALQSRTPPPPETRSETPHLFLSDPPLPPVPSCPATGPVEQSHSHWSSLLPPVLSRLGGSFGRGPLPYPNPPSFSPQVGILIYVFFGENAHLPRATI